MAIRLLCVDDHPVVREGLRALLTREPDIEVVAVAESGEEGVALFEQLRPDVTLMDLKLREWAVWMRLPPFGAFSAMPGSLS